MAEKRDLLTTIVKRPKTCVAIVVAIMGLAAVPASKLETSFSLSSLFLESDPEYQRFERFRERFQASWVFVAGVFAKDDIFTAKNLAALSRITREMDQLPKVLRARSLINETAFMTNGNDLTIAPLKLKLPKTAAEVARARKWALSNPSLAGSMVSKDGKVAAIVVELRRTAETSSDFVEVDKQLRQIVDRDKTPSLRFEITGTPAMLTEMGRIVNKEAVLANISITLSLLVGLFLMLWRVSSALLPIVIYIPGLLCTLGFNSLMGYPMTPLMAPATSLLFFVAVADSVHIAVDYSMRIRLNMERDEALIATMRHLFKPCFFTSATTAVALLALLSSDVRAVREFAIASAFGTSVLFILTFTLAPVVLRTARVSTVGSDRALARFEPLLRWAGEPSRRRAWMTVLISAVLVGAAALVVPNLRTGSLWTVDAFPEGNAVRETAKALDRKLGGAVTLEVLIEGERGVMKQPAFLHKLEAFQEWLEKRPAVSRTISPVTWLKELNRVLHGGDEKYDRLPESETTVHQFYFLLEGQDDFHNYVQTDYSLGRITVFYRGKASGWTKRIAALRREIKRELKGQAKAKINLTGVVSLLAVQERYTVEGLTNGLIFSFIGISILLAFLLKSWRLGSSAFLPNVLPPFLGVGFMAAAHIDLNWATAMIGPVLLGLIVDDTVHFLHRMKARQEKDDTIAEAIKNTVQETGRAITITTLAILLIGVVIGLTASLPVMKQWSWVASVIVLTALLGDLVLLPAVLLLTRSRPNKERKAKD